MASRRPTRLKTSDYKGKHSYFVTCATVERRKLFGESEVVRLIAEQILRTCEERQFEVLAYAFMEDHVHLLVRGTSADADFVSTATLLRQRTALAYRRTRGAQLWQDGYYERVLRPTEDVFEVIQYIRDNPAAAGLPPERGQPPYVWWVGADARSAPL